MAARRWLALVGSLVVPLLGAQAPPATASAAAVDAATVAGLDDRWAAHAVDIRPAPNPVTVTATPDRPDAGPTTGEQVAITNAAAWHTAGVTGAGVKIGVIDFFDVERYWNTSEHGPLPVAGVTARCFTFGQDCTAAYFDAVSAVGDDHGVAVVEIIHDMAPDAEIYIGTASTLVDYGALVDWFAAQGVTIISRSLSSGYDGPGDGRGALDDLAAHANALGITWVNSAGNSGFGRYYRQPVRLNGNRVAFGPAGSATYLPFVGCAALGGVRWSNDWDRPPSERTDYDVYLWDAPVGNPTAGRLVAASTADQRDGAVPIEFFEQDHCPSDRSHVLYLEVRWVGGDIQGDVIEILDYASGLAAYTQAEYSASTPIADSALPGVLAVGAIDPASGGVLAAYSSQGPTNDGRIAPDLSAPSGLASTVIRNGFSGTSASAPVVAGGIALLRAAGLAADPDSLGNLARHLVVDRGPAGPDQQYGAGEFRLPAPPAAPVTPAASRFEPVTTPMRVLDTRPTSPAGPPGSVGVLGAGDIVDLPLAGIVPPGTSAVAVNLTAVALDRPSFVQALPTLGAQLGGYSNVNIDAPFQTRSNFAIVPVDADGSISLYSTGGGDLVVDLLGSFVPTSATVAGGRFVPLEVPERVLDSRTTGALASGATVEVPWPTTIDRSQVSALVVTVTGTGASGPGWLQALPTGADDADGVTSTVNLTEGVTVANTAIVPVDPIGTAGMSVLGFVVDDGTTDVVVDVVGWITSEGAPPSSAGRYVPLVPGRAFDSRTSTGDLDGGVPITIDANAAAGAAVPAGATGVVWNLAPLDARRPGFGRVWADGADEPETSAFNWAAAGEIRATAVISAVADGRATVTVNDGPVPSGLVLAGLIADVFGYFTP